MNHPRHQDFNNQNPKYNQHNNKNRMNPNFNPNMNQNFRRNNPQNQRGAPYQQQQWNKFNPKQKFHNNKMDKNPHFNKGRDQDRSGNQRGGYYQQDKYGRNSNNFNYPQQHRNPMNKHYRDKPRKGDDQEKVFNMGGIKGEIIGSDRQRICLDKGGVTNLNNRVTLGNFIFKVLIVR
jgi:hypothetical protein